MQSRSDAREVGEDGAVSLTTGKLNAVRAAFKAGVKPSAIARQFGISQSDVRKALAQGHASRGLIWLSLVNHKIGNLSRPQTWLPAPNRSARGRADHKCTAARSGHPVLRAA